MRLGKALPLGVVENNIVLPVVRGTVALADNAESGKLFAKEIHLKIVGFLKSIKIGGICF